MAEEGQVSGEAASCDRWDVNNAFLLEEHLHMERVQMCLSLSACLCFYSLIYFFMVCFDWKLNH